MSDRTNITIYCRNEDVDRVAEALGARRDNVDNHSSKGKSISEPEIDCGGYVELEALAAAGVIFYGSHGEGAQYSRQAFASDGKTVHYIVDSVMDGYCIRIDKDGICAVSEMAATRFFEAQVKAEELIDDPLVPGAGADSTHVVVSSKEQRKLLDEAAGQPATVVDVTFHSSSSLQGNMAVSARMSDNSVQTVLTYFDDELTFTREELVGKTADEISQLKFEKDKSYLQS